MAYPGNHTESEILRVPRNLKTRPHAPETKLAYITPEEEGILQALKPGTPHKGPEGIPNYDTWEFDPDSGALTGGSTAGGGGAWSGDPGGGQPEPEPSWTPPKEDKSPKDEEEKEDKQSILAAIGHGDIEEDYIGDEAFLETFPEGQHKLSKQFQRLAAKYGKSFFDPDTGHMSSQAELLLNYLAGVPASKGGGMGLEDPTFGTGETIDPTDPNQIARLALLTKMKGQADKGGVAGILNLKKANLGSLKQGLTPAQHFNFMQQLHQAQPGAFEKQFPVSSGVLPGKLAKMAISPFQTLGTGVLQSLGLAKKKKPDPVYNTGDLLDPSYFYDLAYQTGDEGQEEDIAATEYDIPPLPSEGDEFDLASSLYDWDLYNQYLQSLGGIPTHGAQGGEVQGYRGGGLSELVSDNDMSYNNAIGDFMQRRKYNI